MKKTVLMSLLVLSNQVLADDVCEGLKLFQDSNGKNAVAVLSKDNDQKIFAGTYHQIINRVDTASVSYSLKNSDGNPASILVGDSWHTKTKCTRASCDDVTFKIKTATLTINGVSTVYSCQK